MNHTSEPPKAESAKAGGSDEAEVEVTPEMIEAGALELARFSARDDDDEDAVRLIYSAMERTRRSG